MDSRSDGQAADSRQEQTPWAGLAGSTDQETFLSSWLTVQCSLIRDCCQAVLALNDPRAQRYVPVAAWPEGGTEGERLADVLEQTLAEQEGMLVGLSPVDGSSRFGLAYPIRIDGRCVGAVAVEVAAAGEHLLRPAMEQLQWGAVWIENHFRRRRNLEDGDALDRLKAAVDILAGVLVEKHFDGAAMAFVTSLATRLACDRVSLGLMKKKFAHVEAVSHSAVVGRKMNLLRAIGAAMDEAVAQRAEILYPPPANSQAYVLRDHEHLAVKHGTRAVMTVPLYGRDRYYGAVTLERQKDRPFTAEELAYVKSVAALSGPALEDKHHHDRPIVFIALGAFRNQLSRLFGPGYTGRKAVAVVVLLAALFFALARGDYRISADTVLEGAVQRSVVAPFDGFIASAPARAGDVVAQDDLLCSLDDRDLRLERINWLGRLNQSQRQLQEAVAQGNRAEANIIQAQMDQAKAQLDLAESRLERIALRAPFKGVLLSGDLSQRLGGAVKQGEELFQIAPLDAYRVILKVNEGRIADVAEGQRGELVLSALPAEKFDFTVTQITPLTTAAEGKNFYRVEARLERLSPLLRPGMEGVAKIQAGRRLLADIWTRPLSEWVRLKIWSWWP
ncbi:MAG: HlyD family efflux transporter periplasmic adaptor subunit [Thermodesulfobacteriota bacterium]